MGCASSVDTVPQQASKIQIELYKKEFEAYDTRGTGEISGKDLGKILRSFGHNPTNGDIRRMVNEHGFIDYQRFIELATSMNSDEELRVAFHLLDRDGNGYISAQELKRVVKIIDEDYTNEEVEAMIEEADLDGDGRVNYQEFEEFYRS
ncbi:neo-calmodulin-like [Tubulanus polymorphus]|uniref:neo-calmodulin-like n=1 Tax=Tubulanus polymorphus TaxID=672921 RepID=UPI003DA2B26F